MAAASWDVLIVGAGPGGAMCALSCARAGLRPLLLERNAAQAPRKPCIIEVEKSVFGRCGVPAPARADVVYAAKTTRIFSPSGKPAFHFRGHTACAVKIEKIAAQLLGLARDAGATTRFGVTVRGPLLEGDRVVGVAAHDRRGRNLELRARVVVDATGFDAALVRQLPLQFGMDFVDRPGDRVWAEARYYDIDAKAARAAAEAGRFSPEDMQTQIGLQGGYSVRAFMVSLERQFGYLLTGVKEDHQPPTAADLADACARDLGCFKKLRHHGHGVIRIRRAGLRLVGPGFAAIGEAGGMVIPAHGSGVASAMLAGDSLGKRLGAIYARGSDATTAALWPWAADYMRDRGAVLATYDANRRLLESINTLRDLDPLFADGVVCAEDMLGAAEAAPLSFSLRSLPGRLGGAAKHPGAALKFAAGGPKILWVGRHWQNYPQTWDEAAFRKWEAEAMTLLP
jgi:flavin-dependent dehydrogenase